jgi:hypothetical protein
MNRLYLFISLSLLPCYINAQVYKGQSDISISYGLLPMQEIVNTSLFILGGRSYTSLKSTTGNFSLDYKYYINRRIGIGACIATEQFSTVTTNENGIMKSTTNYKYTTIAAELLYKYRDEKFSQFYTYVSTGCSFVSKSTSASASVVNYSVFNMQYVPIGIRFGRHFAGFLEVGVGYKGLVNGGLSLCLGKMRSTGTPELNYESLNGMIVIPLDFLVDSNLKDLGEIRTEKPRHKDGYAFHTRLRKFSELAKSKGSNAFRIKEILPLARHNVYDFQGQIYRTNNLDALKSKINQENNRSYQKEKCAYLVIYHPEVSKNTRSVSLSINDNDKLVITPGSKYILKIKSEREVKININYSKLKFTVKFGNYYYIDVNNAKGGTFELVDSIQGVIESKLIPNSFLYDIDSDSLQSEISDAPKHLHVPFHKSSNNGVVIIPGSYKVDSSWKYLGKVSTGRPEDQPDLSLEQQLIDISDKAVKDSANVIKIVAIRKLNGNDCYWIKGKMWCAKNTDSIKMEVEKENGSEFGNVKYSYLVIYRLEDNSPLVRNKKCSLIINDTNKIVVPNRAKYIFRIPYDGDVKISVSKNKVVNIKAKKGNIYYVKANVLKRACSIHEVESKYGEIESNILSDLHFVNL